MAVGRAVWVVVGSVVLSATGCSGDEESSPRPTGVSSPTTAAATTVPSDTAETSATASSPPSTTVQPRGLEDTELVGFEDDAAIANEALALFDDLSVLPRHEVLTPVAAAAAGDGELVPDGAEMTARPETWERRGRLAAVVVEVRPVGNDEPDEFAAFLVATEDGWRLSHTERLEP